MPPHIDKMRVYTNELKLIIMKMRITLLKKTRMSTMLFIGLLATFVSSHSNAQCDASFASTSDTLTVDFTATDGSAFTYTWDFGDGNTSTSANPVHTYASEGTYYVCLTVEIFVQGQTVNCTSCDSVTVSNSTAGLPNIESSIEVSVYPNPFQESFAVSVEQFNEDLTIQLMDITGKVVSIKQINKSTNSSLIKFDEVQLMKGIYFLSFLVNDKKISTVKVIKN